MKAAVVLLCVLVSSATAEPQRSSLLPADDFHEGFRILEGEETESSEGYRILLGDVTEVNEYPWMAALVKRGTTKVFCGGSIISSKHILTAAHCTSAGMTRPEFSRYQVLVGAHSLTTAAQSQQRLEVSSIIHHADYDQNKYDNDISIITLNNSISFTREIQPVSLPYSDSYDYSNVIAIVAGWGVLQFQHPGASAATTDVLMKVDVPTMDNDRCEDLYGEADIDITSNMLCAGYQDGGKDACQSDSGGPLIYNTGSRYIQIGIVSFGIECGLADFPGVYTRVTEYLSWISENTASSTTCPPY